jgi:hypothetical protein
MTVLDEQETQGEVRVYTVRQYLLANDHKNYSQKAEMWAGGIAQVVDHLPSARPKFKPQHHQKKKNHKLI